MAYHYVPCHKSLILKKQSLLFLTLTLKLVCLMATILSLKFGDIRDTKSLSKSACML